jgi:type 1 glutamine amidotransferase
MNRIATLTLLLTAGLSQATDPWMTVPGGSGPGKGKKAVLVSGDEEYRSEEALPQLAKILATRHGFDCKVLFAVDPKDGTINPKVNDNIPGLEALADADLAVFFVRFRNLPEGQMKHVVDYVKAGKPIIGLRTSTHAFNFKKESPFFADHHWQNPDGGFGRKVFGETWVAHHGAHGKEGTRGRIAKGQESHPILKGIKDGELFGPTDVYTVKLPLPGDCTPLVYGEVTKTLDPASEAVAGKKNDPMMPVCWTKSYSWGGPTGRVFTSTFASSQDFANEGLRRVFVNACYWCLGMESAIADKTNVEIVGEFNPTPFKAGGHKAGVKPGDVK